MTTPIVIMSFNRPALLAQVLDSLLAQRDVNLNERPTYLFQDGAVNKYSRLRYAADADIAECVRIFKERFPSGEVHASPENIGVCENFYRAERYVFESLKAECAYFFEDDLELTPAYVAMMDKLRDWALSVDNVAYFAAYGDYYATDEERHLKARELTQLDHHWGFGLIGRHWKAMQPLLQDFYKIIVGSDYQRRDHRAVLELYRNHDFSPRATSQDSAKAVASTLLGLARCNTVVSFAKYVGSSGLHMTSEAYDALGYARAQVRSTPIENLRVPDEQTRARLVEANMQMYRDIRVAEYDTIRNGFSPKEYSPARMCTREDVLDAYRFLLCRLPESEAVIANQVGQHPVAEFVNAILMSTEFANLGDTHAKEVASEANLYRLYQLLLHRDPDLQSMQARIDGQYDVRQIAIAIAKSDEFKTRQTSFTL